MNEAEVKEVKIDSVEMVDGQIVLEPEGLEWDKIKESKYIHYQFYKMHYFSSLDSGKIEGKDRAFALNEFSYQYETRKEERLLAFPHRKLYLFFDLAGEKPGANVFFLNKMRTDETKIFKNFIKVSADKNFIGSNGKPMTGFRVLDISSSGASFISNTKEMENLINSGAGMEVKLHWSDLVLSLKNIGINNVVDYIDPRSTNVPMYKIGIKFDKNLVLDKKISILLYDENIKIEDKIEFKNYIKRNL